MPPEERHCRRPGFTRRSHVRSVLAFLRLEETMTSPFVRLVRECLAECSHRGISGRHCLVDARIVTAVNPKNRNANRAQLVRGRRAAVIHDRSSQPGRRADCVLEGCGATPAESNYAIARKGRGQTSPVLANCRELTLDIVRVERTDDLARVRPGRVGVDLRLPG